MKQCKTCGGTYLPIQDDGTEYYHACPPLSLRELEDHIAAGTVKLTPAQELQLAAAQKARAAGPLAVDAPDPVGLFLMTVPVARPNARNENIRITPDGKTAIVSEGAGAVDVT